MPGRARAVLLQIGEDGARGLQTQPVVGQAEAVQKQGAQMTFQPAHGRVHVKAGTVHIVQAGGCGEPGEITGYFFRIRAFGQQQLHRPQTEKFFPQLLQFPAFGEAKIAGGQIGAGQAPGLALPAGGGQVIGLFGRQFVGIDNYPPGQDPGHLPAHQALGLGRILYLVADDQAMALLQQPADIDFRGVQGEPGHGNGLFLSPAAAGEGNVQGLGRRVRVLEKQFIKIPHLKEKQAVGVLGLDIQILPEHGGDFVGKGFGHSSYCIVQAG